MVAASTLPGSPLPGSPLPGLPMLDSPSSNLLAASAGRGCRGVPRNSDTS
jgi:hypothetical protein